jgi:hypothetical protein
MGVKNRETQGLTWNISQTQASHSVDYGFILQNTKGLFANSARWRGTGKPSRLILIRGPKNHIIERVSAILITAVRGWINGSDWAIKLYTQDVIHTIDFVIHDQYAFFYLPWENWAAAPSTCADHGGAIAAQYPSYDSLILSVLRLAKVEASL